MEIIQVNNTPNQTARLNILFSTTPEEEGGRFLEVRQWETASGDHSELIVESGYMDEAGDLQTSCRVLPFHYDVHDVLDELSS